MSSLVCGNLTRETSGAGAGQTQGDQLGWWASSERMRNASSDCFFFSAKSWAGSSSETNGQWGALEVRGQSWTNACPGELGSELIKGICYHCQAALRTHCAVRFIENSQQGWAVFPTQAQLLGAGKCSKNVRFNQGWDYAKFLQTLRRRVRDLIVTGGRGAGHDFIDSPWNLNWIKWEVQAWGAEGGVVKMFQGVRIKPWIKGEKDGKELETVRVLVTDKIGGKEKDQRWSQSF